MSLTFNSTSPTDIDQNFNREDAFLLFSLHCGDVEKTAAALGVRPVALLRVAEDEGWLNKLGKIIELRKSSRPGDFERAMNRAVNYVQAWRARAFCDRMLNRLIKQADENLDDLVFQVDEKINSKTGDVNTSRKINARWAADLVSAIEKAQSLTYLALNDTVQDRNRRKEQAADEGDQAASDLHTRIAAAMHEVGASTSPRALLFDDQLRIAGEMKQEATAAPPSPYDRDH